MRKILGKNLVLSAIDSLANQGTQKQLSILAASISKNNVYVYDAVCLTDFLYFEDMISTSGGHCLPFVEREGGSAGEFVSFMRRINEIINIVTEEDCGQKFSTFSH
jgi:hypothetical protein